MASIQARRRGRRTYYYLVESRRVAGKPRPVVLKYLGTADSLKARLEEAEAAGKPLRADVVRFGAVAALWDLAQRLDLPGTIDGEVGVRSSRPSVGTYLTLAAVNRCLATTSKARFGAWYRRTVLPRLCGVPAKLLNSQRFWDAMEVVSADTIHAVENKLSARLVREFDLDLRTLCFDCTNFDTFFDSSNPAALAQRGHAKSKRTDLRVVGLALMVTLDGEIPLFSEVYAGNQPDSVTFESVTEDLVARYRLIAKEAEHVTLVFDKGNNSKENLRTVVDSPYHVVGSLVPSQHPDLLAVPLKDYTAMNDPRLQGVVAFRTKKVVWGREWTLVLTRSETLLAGQLRGIAQHLAKRRAKLRTLQAKLRRSQEPGNKGKGYTRESLEKHARELSSGQYLKEILEVRVSTRGKRLSLSFHTNAQALEQLVRNVLGKRILFTDNDAWSTEEIVLGYRSQHHVEAAFRQMKDRRFTSFTPIRHWTDQKIRVHAFCCVLALTLAHVLRREVGRMGIVLSTDALLDELESIEEVVNLYPARGSEGGRPQARRVLTRRTRLQEQLFRLLGLARFEKG
ncbi:MAG: IS1634 family transposase [Planctomycetota bacterium]